MWVFTVGKKKSSPAAQPAELAATGKMVVTTPSQSKIMEAQAAATK
jgi:hypothetical protein